MNQSSEMEIDPLATYEYFSGYGLPQVNTNTHQYQNISSHPNYFDVKVEPYQSATACVNNYSTKSNSNNVEIHVEDMGRVTNCSLNEINENPNNIKENTVENIPNNAQTLVRNKKIKKEGKTGQKSYMSEKITDSNFPFYGCAVCNISFKLLADLDSHIATHKDRITSYGLRLKNQIKKKKLRKEQKKLKKLKKAIKKEKLFELDIEIKPEDGYIGNIKAEQFKPENNDSINDDHQKTNVLINGENGVVENQSKIDIPLEEAQSDCKEKSKENDKRKNDKGQTNYNLEKMFKCFACQKQFMLSYYLKLHVRSHTDEKPYTCAECGQCFITASKLGRHTKRIHLAIRHQCRICYKYFSRFEYLTRHFDKKHPEDKLEGEPYDYNAILPYLKELEEQLQVKSEETTKEPELKPKSDNLWDDWPSENLQTSCKAERNEIVVEPLIQMEVHIANEKKIIDLNHPTDGDGSNKEFSLDVEVKKEEEDYNEMDNDEAGKDDSAKDDGFSDDDYFPSNTWAATPKMDSDPSSTVTLKRQKQDGPIKCEVCEKSISSLSYLRIHMRTHTGEKPFKCYICNRGFITSSKMHRHVLTHSETWDETSNLKEEVKSELDSDTVKKKKKRSKESSTKKAKAKFLKKSKRSTAEKQMKRHQKRPHACEYCQKRFLHLETLQVHKKSHEGEELVFKCHFCLMKMDDAESLKEHEATHEEPKPYLCTLCGKTYKKRETMMYHRKHHIPEREYVCDMCPKSFTSPCKLQKHITAHKTDKYVLRYECPVCAHMFNTRYHINMHLVTHQKEGLIVEENRSEILAMVLQNARRIPKNPDATGNMTDKVLPDEQSRMCNICGQVFQHFYYLEEHLKSHGSKIALEDEGKTEEKKHVCQVCNKSFKLHYYLKLHSFTHTKEKPYICQQCGKGFITRGKLKRHLETHTGLKKYQCHICYKFFTRPSYLRIHVRTIHGPQDFRLNKQFGVDSLKESG